MVWTLKSVHPFPPSEASVADDLPPLDEKQNIPEKEEGEKTLRENVLDRYQRAVGFFNERADNAQKVIEEATARVISPEKLLKHMDKKYPYGAPSDAERK